MLSIRSLLALAALTLGGSAHAHTVWLEADKVRSGDFLVRFGGHAGKSDTYDAARLGAAAAFDAAGSPLALQRESGSGGVRLTPSAAPAVMTLSFDNGIWSKAAGGRSINKPMTELPGAVSGIHALKYNKTILQWGASATRSFGQPFELVPQSPAAPRAGQPLQLRVLIDGRPAAGIKLAFGEEGADAITDAEGLASIVARPGTNRLWAGQRQPVQGDPRLTERSIEYSLVFVAE